MFKVVPDQLRVSDGWVRCGQCNEVFDANNNLQPRADVALNNRAAPLVQEPQPEPPPPPPPPAARVLASAIEESGTDAKAEVKIAAEVEEKAHAPVPVFVPPVAVTPPPPAEPFLAVNPRALHIEPEPEEVVVPSRPATLGEQRSAVGRGEKPRRTRKEPTVQVAEEPPQHSFMKAGHASANWRKPWVRAVLWMACLFLFVGLVLQVVIQERDRIAATEPSALRLLGTLCDVLACRISPLRQIESIVIDSSSFAKVRGDVYRLNFTLKNTAQTAIATPALELTLTDMQDQAVVKRVFVATDFGRQQIVIEPGAELVASVPIAVKANTGSAKVSGYRLLSFYP